MRGRERSATEAPNQPGWRTDELKRSVPPGRSGAPGGPNHPDPPLQLRAGAKFCFEHSALPATPAWSMRSYPAVTLRRTRRHRLEAINALISNQKPRHSPRLPECNRTRPSSIRRDPARNGTTWASFGRDRCNISGLCFWHGRGDLGAARTVPTPARCAGFPPPWRARPLSAPSGSFRQADVCGRQGPAKPLAAKEKSGCAWSGAPWGARGTHRRELRIPRPRQRRCVVGPPRSGWRSGPEGKPSGPFSLPPLARASRETPRGLRCRSRACASGSGDARTRSRSASALPAGAPRR